MLELLMKLELLNFLTIALATIIDAIGSENINIATNLFLPIILIVIPIFGIAVAFGKAEVSDVFYRCLMIATYFYFIQNYTVITSALLDFFCTAGLTLGGSELTTDFLYDPSRILVKGVLVCVDIYIPDNFWDWIRISDNLYRFITSISVGVCFALIALTDFIFVLEYHLISTLLIIIFPFGLLQAFSFLSESVISTLFKLNIKLLAFCFIVSLSLKLIEEEIVEKLSSNPSFAECIVCVTCSFAMCYVVWKIPRLASSVITGSPALNAQGLAKAAYSAASRIVSSVSSKIISMIKK